MSSTSVPLSNVRFYVLCFRGADSDDEEFDVAGALSSDGEEDDSDDDVKWVCQRELL